MIVNWARVGERPKGRGRVPDEWEIPHEEKDDDEFGPGSPDWDLSEEHGYLWEPKRGQWPVPSWALILVSLVVVLALLLPGILLFFR